MKFFVVAFLILWAMRMVVGSMVYEKDRTVRFVLETVSFGLLTASLWMLS